MGEETTVSKASSKFESVRTTIPRSVVKQWKLLEGDKIDWTWDKVGEEMVIILRKVVSASSRSSKKSNK